MTYFTLAQIKTKLQYDADIFDEDFVELDTELLGYINEAIDDCESTIHSLYEDYFLVQSTLSLVSGTATYALPSDIYGHKVRGLFYNNPTGDKYVINKIRKLSQTLGYPTDSTAKYRYIVTNASSPGPRIKLYPTPAETNSYVDIFYIRNAKRLSASSDECDIPEFINYIYAHVKYNLAKKEKLPMDIANAEKQLLKLESMMEKTLKEMVVDEEANRIEPDTTFYDDFDTGI